MCPKLSSSIVQILPWTFDWKEKSLLFQSKDVVCTICRNFKTDREGTKIYLELRYSKTNPNEQKLPNYSKYSFTIEISIKFWWNIRNPGVEYWWSTGLMEKHCIWSEQGRNMILLEHGFAMSYFVSNLYHFLLQCEAVPC